MPNLARIGEGGWVPEPQSLSLANIAVSSHERQKAYILMKAKFGMIEYTTL